MLSGYCVLIIFALLRAIFGGVINVNVIKEGATCSRQIPAYAVADNKKLVDRSRFALNLRNVSEQECKMMCTDNRNRDNGKSILCASFSYLKSEKSCVIHTQKAKPVGSLILKHDLNYRYYEKFCLPITAPTGCGEANFLRVDQTVLEGFAVEIVHTKQLDACLGSCVEKNEDCKSVMYFYATGECILNAGTAIDLPEGFVEEPKEKVIYFENGCVVEDPLRDHHESFESQPDSASEIGLTEVELITRKNLAEKQQEKIESGPVTRPPKLSPWSKWNECDKADGRRIRKRECWSDRPDLDCPHDKLMETQWCLRGRGILPDGSLDDPDAVTTREKPGEEEAIEPKSSSSTTEDGKFFGFLRSKESTASGEVLDTSSTGLPKRTKWSSWSDSCVNFIPEARCSPQSRTKVGFQTRQCLDSNPESCPGPFLRYCFIPCHAS